ncbi:MAG: carboxypeptidase-like regulatory domain-containing protein [Planctomycetota bacterium]
MQQIFGDAANASNRLPVSTRYSCYSLNEISRFVAFFLLLYFIPGCDDSVPVSVMVTDETKNPIPDALVAVLGQDLDESYVPRVVFRTDESGKGKSSFIGHSGGFKGIKVSADGYATLRKRVPCGKDGIEEHIILEKEKPDEP